MVEPTACLPVFVLRRFEGVGYHPTGSLPMTARTSPKYLVLGKARNRLPVQNVRIVNWVSETSDPDTILNVRTWTPRSGDHLVIIREFCSVITTCISNSSSVST